MSQRLQHLLRRLRGIPTAPSTPDARNAVDDPAPDNARYDRETVAVMERCLDADSNAIDVGCHEGSILRQILRIAPQGMHFAFEPLPDLHAQLVESFGADPRVRLSPVALSDRRGRSRFQHVVTNPGYSGFRRRRYDREHEEVQEIEVEAERLDHLLPPDVPIHFVKIDVEGAELEVLRGAVGMLRRHRPTIVFEHGLGAADWYGTTPEQIYALLGDECGLRVTTMWRWLRGDTSLSQEAFARRFREGMDYYFMAHPAELDAARSRTSSSSRESGSQE